MKKKLLKIRTEALDYIKAQTKGKRIELKKCIIDYKSKELVHINKKMNWIGRLLEDKSYSTDYLCNIADELKDLL